MSLNSYLSDAQLKSYLQGENTNNVQETIAGIMSSNINGIEGLPYQFLETADNRLSNGQSAIGRKYGDRVFSRLPLLFLTPCEPLFMDDWNKNDRNIVANALLANISNYQGLLENQNGKYYSMKFNYTEYYAYLNTMLTCVSVYLGIQNETIPGRNKKICEMDWGTELNDSFKTFFSSEENVIFYLDGLTSVSEGFSNDTTESSLASTINGFSDQAKEIRFLFGGGSSVANTLVTAASEVSDSVSSQLQSLGNNLGGGIIGSLAGHGVNSVLEGGKISFPRLWNNSSYEKSYSLDIKLRSPDHDRLSLFLNILKPYCKLLCFVMSRKIQKDANGYSSPFLVRAYSKGMFNVDMGIISSMSVTKGAECQWSDDGVPTQIDISIQIDDLYSNLLITFVLNFFSEIIIYKGYKNLI